VLALGLALMLGARAVVQWVYWPMHREQTIRGWMTPGYVARSWNVPPEVVGAALELEPGSWRGLTLERLAAARGVPVAELEARLLAAIVAAQDPP
jgi:hypothetical protein